MRKHQKYKIHRYPLNNLVESKANHHKIEHSTLYSVIYVLSYHQSIVKTNTYFVL